MRRTFRIFPPLYIVLVLVLILINFEILDSTHSYAGLLSSFLHYANYFIIAGGEMQDLLPGMRVTWSLAVEEHFYLLFPIIFLLGMKRLNNNSFTVLLVFICALVFLWRYYLFNQEDFYPQRIYWATFARIDSILFGAILAIKLNPVLDKKRLNNEFHAIIVLILSLGVILVTLLPKDPLFREVFRYSIQGIFLIPIFYLAINRSDWYFFKVLNTRPLQWLGKISYTFYLSHLVMLLVADKYIGSSPYLSVVVAFFGSIAFSLLMYFTVEKRMGRLRSLLH